MEKQIAMSPDVFFIPDTEKNYLIYAPRLGVALKANTELVSLLKNVVSGKVLTSGHEQVLEQLTELGILSKSLKTERESLWGGEEEFQEYKPTRVTLLPTYRCNLRCVYCYAKGGDDVGQDMTFDIARAAIDLVVKNAVETTADSVSLSFHGGGEPFLTSNFPLIKQCVAYLRKRADKHGLVTQLNACTNGVIGEENLQWVIGNFDNLNISIDGPKAIQDAQRPLRGKGSSFERVLHTIEQLEVQGFPYGVRSTITSKSAPLIPEIVAFLHKCSPSVSELHFESLFVCGRCESSNAQAPETAAFIDGMRRGKKVAEKLGISLFQAGTCPAECSEAFCGAIGENFFVTPRGDVTTCLEVCRKEDSASKLFFVGKYEDNAFTFFPQRIKKLRRRTLANMPFCKQCFARWNCSGDCLAKSFAQTGNLFTNKGNSRCEIIRTMLVDEIQQRLNKKEVAHA